MADPEIFYVERQDIIDAIGIQAFNAIFDDEGTGTVVEASVDMVRRRATRLVDGHLLKMLPNGAYPLNPVPPLAKEAALEFAVGLSYLRDKTYAKRYAEKKHVDEFVRGEKLASDLALNIQRMTPAGTAPQPTNTVGGVYQGSSDQHPDGVGGGIFRHGFGDF